MHTLRIHLLLLAPLACSGALPPAIEEVPVEVNMVALDAQHSPVVVLKEKSGPRRLPIWIGTAEARSIAMGVERFELPRPNTHDLMKRVIDGFSGEVVRVVVTELTSGTYHAILFLLDDGRIVEVDSRPSDAIALALRTGAPIFVRAPLFESAAPVEPEQPQQQI